jgi:hypothetical protein
MPMHGLSTQTITLWSWSLMRACNTVPPSQVGVLHDQEVGHFGEVLADAEDVEQLLEIESGTGHEREPRFGVNEDLRPGGFKPFDARRERRLTFTAP